jgi:hypothetical protein
MARDVFISYSSKNKDAADAVCAALEGAGVSCWIAPRDTEVGAYGPSIIRAIKAARVFVLILSEESNTSQHVLREVERAVNAKLPIVPLRLGEIALSEEMEYYVASQHWIDGFPGPLANHLDRLIARVKAALAGERPSRRERREDEARIGPRRSGLGYRIERMMVPLSRLPPPVTALCLILLGMVVIGASLFIGIGNFEYSLTLDGRRVTKEVGYLAALNWSLACLLIIPAMVGFGLYTFKELPTLFEQLARRRMVVDDYMQPVSAETIKEFWRRHARVVAVVSAFAFLCSIGYTLWEFYHVIGRHYLAGAFPPEVGLAHAYHERDWSVASLLGTPEAQRIDKTANALFALFVYFVYVGLASGFTYSVYIYLLGVATFVYALAHRGEGVRLVPDLRGPDAGYDRRAGLQLFEPLIQNALFVTLLTFLLLFLIHLQNVYLRAPDRSILAFAVPELGGAGWLGTLESLAGAVTARAGLANLNSALAYGFGSFLFVIVLVILSVTLRLAAQRSRRWMHDHVADEANALPAWLAPLGREKALARLGAMSLWPARWPRVNQLAIASVIAGLCLVFYKVGLVLVIAGLAMVGYRLLATPALRPR